MSRARALLVPTCLLTALSVVACGDDNKKKPTIFDASMDGGVDAGTDAGFIYDVPEYRDAAIPKPKPTCTEAECLRIAGECRTSRCNGATGECEFDNADDGTACGDPTNDVCTLPDLCMDGLCAPNHYPKDTPCGLDRECHERDTCDGAGTCADNGFTAAGTACGDPSEGECDAADTCDGMGTCADNSVAAGEPCNPDKHVDCGGEAYPDTCNGMGLCIANGLFSAPGECPQGHNGQGACQCGNVGIMPGHPCPDVCDPTGLCMEVGNACL